MVGVSLCRPTCCPTLEASGGWPYPLSLCFSSRLQSIPQVQRSLSIPECDIRCVISLPEYYPSLKHYPPCHPRAVSSRPVLHIGPQSTPRLPVMTVKVL